MGFADDMRNFAAEVEADDQAIFVETAALAFESIVEGSPITGAPGQPVDTGAEKAAWHLELAAHSAAITNPMAYAPVIENDLRSSFDEAGLVIPRPRLPGGGVRPHVKSTVGGHHSVKVTVANIDRLIDEAGRRVGRPS